MKKMNMEEIVKFYRKQKCLTQGEVAERLFSSEKTISAYETGIRGISTDVLEQLADIFEMDIQDFFNKEKIKEDMRIAEIKEVDVVKTIKRGPDNAFLYVVEIKNSKTREILHDFTSPVFFREYKTEEYIEQKIQPKFKKINRITIDLSHIIYVKYVTEWDSGYAAFESIAKYDTKENVVFDIESADTDGIDIEHLDREYIIQYSRSGEGWIKKEIDVVPIGEEEYYEEELKSGEMVRADY